MSEQNSWLSTNDRGIGRVSRRVIERSGAACESDNEGEGESGPRSHFEIVFTTSQIPSRFRPPPIWNSRAFCGDEEVALSIAWDLLAQDVPYAYATSERADSTFANSVLATFADSGDPMLHDISVRDSGKKVKMHISLSDASPDIVERQDAMEDLQQELAWQRRCDERPGFPDQSSAGGSLAGDEVDAVFFPMGTLVVMDLGPIGEDEH